ncbi:MAG: hypothetical protein KatS3mg027_1763 [Bacteroidia bacterium]|nr:MAG: hypothetical protein KatS3mg027_1763 [Bacteroidia bacterium]
MKLAIKLFVLLFPILAFSQSALDVIESGQDLNVLYRNEHSFNIFLNTRGWGFGYRRGKHITGRIKGLFEIEGAYLKHPKEVKLRGNAENKVSFVYGKLNSIMILRSGIGTQHTIFKRNDRKAVEIRATYFLEGNLSFAKPYYVQIVGEGGFRNTQIVKYDPQKITSIDSIVGRGSFLYGFDEIKIYPAITAKFLMSIEYANVSYKIKAIEVGIIGDFYPRALPIMAQNPAENYIITLQLGFVFGKKWF